MPKFEANMYHIPPNPNADKHRQTQIKQYMDLALVTTRPIPYLHQTSSVLRRLPLELHFVLLE